MFQHTAARRRLQLGINIGVKQNYVSTHSRAEAAARYILGTAEPRKVSTHSRAEAAAARRNGGLINAGVSTHSRAEAAATIRIYSNNRLNSFNTQPRGGGCLAIMVVAPKN